MDPIIGQIILVPFNWAPVGWALCDGHLLPINQYQALFSLLGTTYGGDGRTNFAVPDLRSRVPVGSSNGAVPGLTQIALGAKGGGENETLTVNNLPAHGHTTVVTLAASAKNGTSQSPANLVPAVTNDPIAGGSSNSYAASDNSTHLAPSPPQASSITGAGQPFSIRDPYLGLNYIIAITGVYPTRP